MGDSRSAPESRVELEALAARPRSFHGQRRCLSTTRKQPVSAQATWRPSCYVCGRFVPIEAYDCWLDYYSGCYEEGYTACHEHGGPSRERCLEIRAEHLALSAAVPESSE